MVKRNISTLVKEGVAGVLALGGVAMPTYLTAKLVDLKKYLGPTLTRGYDLFPIIRDVGITTGVSVGLFYIAKEMLEAYDENLLENQRIQMQKRIEKLQAKELKNQRYIQEKQKKAVKNQEKIQTLEADLAN